MELIKKIIDIRPAPRQVPQRHHPAVRPLDLRHPFRGHLHRDRLGRHALPARAIPCFSPPGRSPPSGRSRSAGSSCSWPRRPSSGDTVNYWVGHILGPKVFSKEKARFFKKEYLDRTHAFYEKHGGKTIIIARFVPIVRTFAPLVAGIGRMSYGKFLAYNVIGGVGWVVLLVGAGYFFGNIPFVRKNFSLAILAIIVISTVPIVIEYPPASEEQSPISDPRAPRIASQDERISGLAPWRSGASARAQGVVGGHVGVEGRQRDVAVVGGHDVGAARRLPAGDSGPDPVVGRVARVGLLDDLGVVELPAQAGDLDALDRAAAGC